MHAAAFAGLFLLLIVALIGATFHAARNTFQREDDEHIPAAEIRRMRERSAR